jgi:ABC-type branched-subunit amino acid transport system substrate-binding protein
MQMRSILRIARNPEARAKRFLLLALGLILLLAQPTLSQEAVPGVTNSSIRIGSCSALDGPASFLGQQIAMGALAYFRMVNDQGGVFGRTIDFKTFDDKYDPNEAASCFGKLVQADVFAAGLFVGTPTAAKYVPLAEAKRIPVVGLFTGAQLLYEPLKHYVMNVRASYFDETEAQIDGLWAQGIRKIAVIYQDDAFGQAVLEGVRHALARYHAAPVALGTFERNTLDVERGIAPVREGKPEAVILVGPYAPVGAILKRAHSSGWSPLFLTVSFVGTEGLIRAAGRDADGIVITQVMPPYDRTDLATIKLYREALQKYSGTEPNFVSLEGFVDAMVIVEGLKRAGKDLTREKFIGAIESMHDLDVGLGARSHLRYGPRNHKGFDSIYPTVIKNGKAVAFSDWKDLPVH